MHREHAHPLTIFSNLWRVLYLVIIPVLRGFLGALQGDLARWLRGAWIDILVLLLMVGLAVWRWWRVTYRCDDDALHIYMGVLYEKYTRIPWNRIVTLSLVERYYLRPFRAAHFRADTMGGSHKDADFTMLISFRKGQGILEKYGNQRTQNLYRVYIPRTGSIFALALLSSNSFAGIVFMATFISLTGKLLGEGFSRMIIGTFENVARALAFGIPPAAAALAYVLMGGWLIGFLLTFVRYVRFSISRRPRQLRISGGFITRREYLIQHEKINFIDIRQSAISKAFRLFSLYLSAVGYGKHKDDISCIIPTEGREAFYKNRDMLFPRLEPAPRQIIPKLGGVMRFIGPALTWLGGILAGVPLLSWLFPNWSSFILYVGLMMLIPALLFLIVRLMDFSTGGVSVRDNTITLRYSKGFTLHIVVIPADKVSQICFHQGFFQKLGPNCDLILYTKAERRLRHRCRSLHLKDISMLLSLVEYSPDAR